MAHHGYASKTHFIDYRIMSAEARKKNLWLYDSYGKTWLTPEEFDMICQLDNNHQAMLQRIVLLPPSRGITAGYKQLEQIKIKLEAFTKRVMAYYENKQQA